MVRKIVGISCISLASGVAFFAGASIPGNKPYSLTGFGFVSVLVVALAFMVTDLMVWPSKTKKGEA